MTSLKLNNTINRIDRDREGLRSVLTRRLSITARSIQTEARHGMIDFKRLTPILARQALIARLTGMWRAVLEYERATGRRCPRPMQLSRESDDKRDRELLAWLIAFLGLPEGQIQTMSGESMKIAVRATSGIKSPVMQRMESAVAKGESVSVMPSSNPLDVFGNFGKADALGELFPRIKPAEVTDIFNRAGVGRVKTHTIDAWAETVAYGEFERGRDDIHKTPAVSEALWGFRWSSILDSKTTLGCRHLDGWIAPKSDGWMQALKPPRHWNCRSVLIPVWQSSALNKPPTPFRPAILTDAELGRLLDQKEAFLRSVA